MIRSIIRMSSEYSLEAFQKRARLAEDKLNLLRQHLAELKNSSGNKHEQELRLKNKELKARVDSLRSQLKADEIANGVKQVGLPSENVPVVVKPTKEPTEKKQPKVEQKKEPAKAKPSKAKETKPKTQKNEPAVVDVSRLDMRVAQIVHIDYHPDADTLYVEQINVGEETNRTVITGVVHQVPIEKMRDRRVIVMCNLKPVKMRGIISQGMVMCAIQGDGAEPLDPPPGAVPGERITFEGYPGEPDAVLNSKKKIWEKIQPDLHVNNQGVPCYKGVPFMVKGKGVCKAQTFKECEIR